MTRIIFRKLKEDDSIVAVFPDDFHNRQETNIVCYQRIGQHGACCPAWVKESTVNASEEEYKSLLNELVYQIGYNDLKIMKRFRG